MIGQIDRITELAGKHNLGIRNQGTKQSGECRLKNVAAVFSGKGGTGKTFFAANLAYLYAKNHKVLLIDLDQNLSNLNILFNITTEKTLDSFLDSKSTFREIITEYRPNLHLVLGEAGSLFTVNNNKLGVNQIERLFEQFKVLRNEYDLILLDVGAGVTEENMMIVTKSDLKILVTNPEPTALMDAYVSIKVLHKSCNSDEVFVVVNRCIEENETEQAFGNLRSAVSHFLDVKISYLTEIPESNRVRTSILDQQLFAANYGSSPVASSIEYAADKIGKILSRGNQRENEQVFNINQTFQKRF